MPDHHKFHTRLPRRKREFFWFMMIISIISVNIIAPVATMYEEGFRLESWGDALTIIPLVWLCVVALVLLTYKPAQWLTNKIINPTDGYNAHILVNILVSVFLLSILLTVVAMWIANGKVDFEPLEHFKDRWPRNFTISFIVEAIIAQPIARLVMHHYHLRADGKSDDDNSSTASTKWASGA